MVKKPAYEGLKQRGNSFGKIPSGDKRGEEELQNAQDVIGTENSHLVDGKYSIKDLVDVEILRNIFEKFSQATGFTTGFVSYPEQEILIATGWRDICTKFHRAFPESAKFCKESNVFLTKQLKELKELNIRPCGNGLVDGATPIIIKGKHLANLFTGQILFEKPDRERFKKQAGIYGFDSEKYLDALDEVPIETENKLKKTLSFLSGIATMIAEQGVYSLKIQEGEKALQEEMIERRQAEEEMHHLRNLLSNIINSMPSVLVGVDSAGKVTQWNQEAEKSTGVTAGKALGCPLDEVFPEFGMQMEKVGQAIQDRKTIKEEKIPWERNREKIFVVLTVYPLIGNSVEGAVIRLDDVTERVSLEEMMIQAEKMVSIGSLAAGMAHEINNPLSAMLQSAQNIVRRTSPELKMNLTTARECGTDLEAIRSYLEKRDIFRFIGNIRESGIRAAGIIKNMLQFSRRSESKKVPVSLPELIDRTLELASSDYDLKKKYDFRNIRIQREYDPDLPEVACVEMEIGQVLLNLLKNAAQAMGHQKDPIEPPKITLRTRRDGEMARIEVEDNGPGMNDEVRKRIFEPFFTIKDVGSGTGLGLSVSYFIVTNNHQGLMSVESSEGKGSRFIINLPICQMGS